MKKKYKQKFPQIQRARKYSVNENSYYYLASLSISTAEEKWKYSKNSPSVFPFSLLIPLHLSVCETDARKRGGKSLIFIFISTYKSHSLVVIAGNLKSAHFTVAFDYARLSHCSRPWWVFSHLSPRYIEFGLEKPVQLWCVLAATLELIRLQAIKRRPMQRKTAHKQSTMNFIMCFPLYRCDASDNRWSMGEALQSQLPWHQRQQW